MAAKTKYFRVAVEGTTTDGRKIERQWLEQIAKHYDRDKYGARVFIEHIRGINPEFGFRCLGDVLAVKTEEVEIDGKKKLALYAQIDPTPEFVSFTKGKQKIYSSIEVDLDFAGSGEAYLVGLGATDTPASLGTEVLEFAAGNPAANPFARRKVRPENVFSAAIESEIAFEEDGGPSLFNRVMDLLRGKSDKPEADARYDDLRRAVEAVAQAATENAAHSARMRQEVQSLRADLDAAQHTVADLERRIDHTPSPDPHRQQATGSAARVVTDC